MPRSTPIQVAFNAGALRSTFDGRIDHERYAAGCKTLRNFIPLVEGPAERRAGTRFVAVPSAFNYRVRLIDFEFNAQQAYVLEIGESTMRFYTQNGLLLDPATLLPVELATPWTAEQAKVLQYKQSADVMFLWHPDVPPQKLSRTSASAFSLTAYVPNWFPFRTENITEADKIQASAATGAAITLTASGGLTFAEADVGRYLKLRELVETEQPEWAAGADVHNVDTGTGSVVGDLCHWEGNVYRLTNLHGKASTGTRPPIHTNTDGVDELDGKWSWLYVHSGAGYVRITAYVDPTHVTAEVVHELPASVVSAATFRWSWGFWDNSSGYPSTGDFFEERLWLAGTRAEPDTIVGSRPGGAFDDFKEDTTAEGAVRFRMLSGKPNPIRTVIGTKTLNIATAGGIFPCSGQDPSLAISIDNLLSRQRQVNYGAAPVQGLAVDNVALFVQRSRRSIREVLFDFDADTFTAPDLSKLAAHLLARGVVGMVFAQEPYRMLLAWMEDGSLAGALYDRPQEALGWFEIALGGAEPFVESVTVIPHPDGDCDQVWLAVRRRFGSTDQRTVEFMEKPFLETSAQEDAFFVDCGVSYAGAPTSSVGGLTHLEGQTVEVLADGARVGDRVVSGGAIALDEPASKVAAGLGFRARLVPMRLEAGSDDGTAQGKVKRISHAVVRFFRTSEGIYFGTGGDLDELEALPFRDAFDAISAPVPLVDGDVHLLEWPQKYDQGGLLALEARGPGPATIVSVMPQVVTAPR